MDIHRLTIFCKVVELKSFTRAAEATYLSQPTISEHIRTLEEFLGEKLLDRLGKEIFPTAAGRLLYDYAQRIIQLRDDAIHAVSALHGRLAGRLVIAASTIPGTYIIPKWVGSFKAEHPGIQIALNISSSAQVVEAVLNGEVEFGMVGSFWKDIRLELEPLFSDQLMLTVHRDHPWSERKQIAMEALYGEPFIMRRRGSGTRMVMERVLAAAQFDFSRFNVVAEVATTEAVRESVKARIGVSILSLLAVADDVRNGLLDCVAIESVRFRRPFYLIRRKKRELSPLSREFIGHLRRGAKKWPRESGDEG